MKRKRSVVLAIGVLPLLCIPVMVSSPGPNQTPVLVTSTISPVPTTFLPDNLPEKKTTRICYDRGSTGKDWPVEDSAAKWNVNGSVLLSDVSNGRCNAHVVINVAPLDSLWGDTQFYRDSIIRITLSPAIPIQYRNHVLCHEFGHVLGLSHKSGGCMSTESYLDSPLPVDLKFVAETPWFSENASRLAQTN